MPKFSLDYDKLSNSVDYVDNQIFKLSDVKHKLEKVGFDIVRFKDGSPDELWQIQSADDGDYIVAKYTDEEAPKTASNTWDALVSNGSVNVFYKGQPITKIATSDPNVVKRFLPEKLANDKAFVKALLSTLDETTRNTVLKLYPELA